MVLASLVAVVASATVDVVPPVAVVLLVVAPVARGEVPRSLS